MEAAIDAQRLFRERLMKGCPAQRKKRRGRTFGVSYRWGVPSPRGRCGDGTQSNQVSKETDILLHADYSLMTAFVEKVGPMTGITNNST